MAARNAEEKTERFFCLYNILLCITQEPYFLKSQDTICVTKAICQDYTKTCPESKDPPYCYIWHITEKCQEIKAVEFCDLKRQALPRLNYLGRA